MSSGIPYKQDLPPKGGYAPIRYKRNLPARGPNAVFALFTMLGISAYGFYRIGQGNIERRELKRERVWSRIHLTPLLLAETDRDSYRREKAMLTREKEIMKDVPGWEAGKSVYNSKRYTPPTYVVMAEEAWVG